MKQFLSLFLALPLLAKEHPIQPDYQINCMACHALDTQIVGPSLVYIAATYPESKRAEFLAWAKAPGKKNPKLIEMPSMAHVPDDTLTLIHQYILDATQGVKEKKGKDLFQDFKEPKRPLPYVARASMPDSSPASVGVVLPGDLSLCWDTEACRFRYAYLGNKTNLFNMWKPASLPNKPYYRETSETLFPFPEKPRFLGYKIIDQFPEFHYRIGSLEVHELIGTSADKITRTFKTSSTSPLTLDLTHEGKATLTSNKGVLKDGKLTLSAAEASSFILTISK